MLRKILVVLGIITAVASGVPIAQAQSVPPSSSTDSSFTLRGDSLRRIERRTIGGDSSSFFNETETPQLVENNSIVNVGRMTESPSNSPFNGQLDIVVGDTLNPRDELSFPPAGEIGDRQRVKLEVPLGQ